MKQYYVYCHGFGCPVTPLHSYDYLFVLDVEKRTLFCTHKNGGAHNAFSFLDDLPEGEINVVQYLETVSEESKVYIIAVGNEHAWF